MNEARRKPGFVFSNARAREYRAFSRAIRMNAVFTRSFIHHTAINR
jgi:hypothetical protein